MASLLNDTEQEDEFYKNTYGGGFLEVSWSKNMFAFFKLYVIKDDADDAYVSPVESEHDEIDSDFYNTEEEDEPVSDVDEKEPSKRRTKYRVSFLFVGIWQPNNKIMNSNFQGQATGCAKT